MGTSQRGTLAAVDDGVPGLPSRGHRRGLSITAAGQTFSTAVLSADVVDGERARSLSLSSLALNQSPAEDAFRKLVAAAFQHRHEALG